jgi:hypothetical protein
VKTERLSDEEVREMAGEIRSNGHPIVHLWDSTAIAAAIDELAAARASRSSPGAPPDLAEIEKFAARAVEEAVDAALGEVRRQGGADYLLREARTDGINGSQVWLAALLSAVRRLASPPAEDGLRASLCGVRGHLKALMEHPVYAPARDLIVGQVLAASQKIDAALATPNNQGCVVKGCRSPLAKASFHYCYGHAGLPIPPAAALAAPPREPATTARGDWMEGWTACRAQMVEATKRHADMVGEKGGGSREGAAAMTAVLWLASMMKDATPVPTPAPSAPTTREACAATIGPDEDDATVYRCNRSDPHGHDHVMFDEAGEVVAWWCSCPDCRDNKEPQPPPAAPASERKGP